jgi:hypothetical protein
VGAIALTIAGASLLYSDGTYYETVYVQGATQYQVVAPPAGATLPGTSLPADRIPVTISGTTYYLYGNTFYKRVVADGKETFVVVTKPAGLVSVKALPEDFEPLQKGSVLYFRSKDRYYVSYLDPGGEQLYLVADPPVGAGAAVPAQTPGSPAPAAVATPQGAPVATPAPAAKPSVVTLTANPGTPLTVRVGTEINSKSAQAGQRFQGNLASDLVTNGRVLATSGTKVYGRVVEAKAGTGSGGKPVLVLELTDIELNASVIPIVTEKSSFSAEGAKGGGKKVVGGMALGAGIGGMIDGGEGAAVGAVVGTVAGAAAASAAPGSQVAVVAGTALEFRLTAPLSVSVAI